MVTASQFGEAARLPCLCGSGRQPMESAVVVGRRRGDVGRRQHRLPGRHRGAGQAVANHAGQTGARHARHVCRRGEAARMRGIARIAVAETSARYAVTRDFFGVASSSTRIRQPLFRPRARARRLGRRRRRARRDATYVHLSRGADPYRRRAKAAIWEWQQAQAGAAAIPANGNRRQNAPVTGNTAKWRSAAVAGAALPPEAGTKLAYSIMGNLPARENRDEPSLHAPE